MKTKFERIVKFSPPFDKRSKVPGKNYGMGSMKIWFILKGKKGAVQILLSTALYTQNIVLEYAQKQDNYIAKQDTFDCWDVGFHSKKRPEYMDTSQKNECDIFGKCYYDGSSLRGEHDKVPKIFLEKGEEGIFKYLEKYYKEVFNDD